MRLYISEWGTSNPKKAVLIHDVMDSSEAWGRVAEELVKRSYHVIAVDLRGHGRSGRGDYTTKLFAQDILETIPHKVHLVVGHGYGGTLAHIISRILKPQKVIYVEPRFKKHGGKRNALHRLLLLSRLKRSSKKPLPAIAKRHHGWSTDDIQAKKASCKQWDPTTVSQLTKHHSIKLPQHMHVPSLAVLSERKSLLSRSVEQHLEKLGYTIRHVPNTKGSHVFQDNFGGFFDTIQDWL